MNETRRVVAPEAEKLIEQEFKVLDHGFVRLIDYNGTDSSIVRSARVSYGDGTKTVREDKGLINYLISNEHWSPIEQVNITFHMKLPIFVARQIIRHRTARLNEYSGRYSVMGEDTYVPELDRLQKQSVTNKQGSDALNLVKDPQKLQNSIKLINTGCRDVYEDFLEEDLSRELSRIVLPLNTYTEWYWQIDLRNLFNFLKLRLDKHAQYEVRVYAEVMAIIAQAVAPFAYEAFENNILYGMRLNRKEVTEIYKLLFESENSFVDNMDLTDREKQKLRDKFFNLFS